MILRRIVIFLLFLGVFKIVTSFDFADAEENGVIFGEKTLTSQIILVNELNENTRVKLVLLKNVQGEILIELLNDKIDIQQESGVSDDEIYLTANTFDYEELIKTNTPTTFAVDVIEGNDITTKQSLSVEIINIDDESPSLLAKTCAMDEETLIAVGNSSCVFQVTDPDGFLSLMVFDIDGSENANDLFELVFKEIPDNNTQDADIYLVLKDNKKLDFEQTSVYQIEIEAKDAAGHGTQPFSTVAVLVNVNDISDQPPVWYNIITFLAIDEETNQTIFVKAKDGDFDINNEVNYDVKEFSGKNYISMDATSGKITIKPIDRDRDDINEYLFQVVAYEVKDPASRTTANITLYVNDLDDNIPAISSDYVGHEVNLLLEEDTVDLGLKNIYISDIDLGENAVYNISIVSSSEDTDYASAFSVTPSRGFENTTVYLRVTDPRKLDYEDKTWRSFTILLQSVGSSNPDNNDSFPITITLEDINDEPPVFEKHFYVVKFSESSANGTISSELIQATDEDDYDIKHGLKHRILGEYSTVIEIDELGGFLKLTADNVLDYEKQKLLLLQVQATDAASHSATALVIIQIQDSNDEPPVIHLGKSEITINENVDKLSIDIYGSDPDADADLEFSISWENSYAEKKSNSIEDQDFEKVKNCFTIKTELGDKPQTATAKFVITNDGNNFCLNYEVFDSLTLELIVTDKNSEGSEEQSMSSDKLLIHLTDINDNAPIFDNFDTYLNVSDGDKATKTVATVTATDADVDLETVLTYSIQVADDNNLDWFDIDSATGVITVKETIDCDVEIRGSKPEKLLYNVSASDGIYDTEITITINIIDINDNPPVLTDLIPVSIPENSTFNSPIATLDVTDSDRDNLYNLVVCAIDPSESSEITNRFKVENNELVVNLEGDADLDREKKDQYTFKVQCQDNPNSTDESAVYTTSADVIIRLTDINDVPPRINCTEIKDPIPETYGPGLIAQKLLGIDDDLDENGEIEFVGIIQIERFDKDHQNVEPPPEPDYFSLISKGFHDAYLNVTKSLEGFYGDLVLTINLTDHGNPALTNQVPLTLHILKCSTKNLTITYPTDEHNSIVLKTKQAINSTLVLSDDTTLPNITASDNQQDKFDLFFRIEEDNHVSNNFAINKIGVSEGELWLIKELDETLQYEVTITAYIGESDVCADKKEFKSVSQAVTISFSDD